MTTDIQLTWKDVLDCKKWDYGYIDKMNKAALDVGYSFFLWNNRVYKATEEGREMTQYTIEHIR